ncbi:MAG TPA: DUF2339 domain-containing protein [Candidatus Solibacter sp.]|nr:DUF2339 domain-containing protein [Candidatus Solibacter sp.]
MPLLILLAVLFGLLLLVSPVLAISALIAQSALRKKLKDITEENAKQINKLQRAIGELQSRFAAGSAPATANAEKPMTLEARLPVPVPGTFPAAKIPAPVVIPPRVEVQPPIAPAAPPTISGAETKPERAMEQKPFAPVSQAPPKESTPIAPSVSPKVVPPPATPQSPAVPQTPPPAAARVTAPPQVSPLRTPAPKKTLQQRMSAVSALEETLGANWFAKLGGIMIVIGVAIIGVIKLANLGPAGKVAISYLVALVLLCGGIYLEKLERFQLFGRVGIGCGWALLFFTTYAIRNIAAMHVLNSPVLDCVLMLVVALGMAAHTLRYKSQYVTGLSFLLGYTTIALSFSEVVPSSRRTSDGTVYGLLAGAILAIGLVSIVLKLGWFELEVFGILSSYLNHLYWLYHLLGPNGAHGRAFPEYQASIAMLFFYWLTFRVSYVLRGIKTDLEEHVSTVAALLNTLLLLGVMKFQSVQPDLAYIALLAIGILECSFAQLPVTRRRRRAFIILSLLGSALMIVAVPSKLSGNPVAYLWLVGAEIFLLAGIIFKEVVFRRVGLVTGVLVGIDLFGFNFRPFVNYRAEFEGLVLDVGILFGLCAIVFFLNALHIGSRWKEHFTLSPDRRLIGIHSYLGTFAAATSAWAFFSYDWTALAFAAVMLALAAIGRRLQSRHLQIQYSLLGALTLYRAFVFNLHIESPSHSHITTRLVTLPILAIMFYLTAKLAPLDDDQGQRIFRALFSFAGSGLIGLLIWFEAPDIWMGTLFLAAGAIIALAGRRWRLSHLGYQEHLFAIAAVLRTLDYNNHILLHYGPFSVRILTVSLVAAGLYAISRRATLIDAPHARLSAYLHTTAATALLALLMWYEASTGWLAAFWALFAFALTMVDRRFELDDSRWQAHALAALTMIRAVSVNMYVEDTWHGVSVRLLSLSIVAVVFYAMTRIIRMSDELRARDFHHIYSWSASLLVSLLLWHELQPLSIAVGLAVFGLVLFEYGFLRKIVQFHYQAYVAFVAAFARIFFANLTASEQGELFGPRLYTVFPLVLIFFFVYAQLSGEEDPAGSKPRLPSDAIVAYLGTATLAVLFYFEFPFEWVVTAYAALAFMLFSAAWALRRPVFLHQGILLTMGTFARGMAHNLFGASYFAEGDWRGRYFVVGSAVAILLATQIFAFPLRGRYVPPPNASRWKKALSALVARPEQLQFFVPVILVTTMLALKMRAAMVTVSWGVEGVLIVALALSVKERSFLRTGFGLLLLCIGKVFAMDIWRQQGIEKGITIVVVGTALVAVSLLYVYFRENLRKYL